MLSSCEDILGPTPPPASFYSSLLLMTSISQPPSPRSQTHEPDPRSKFLLDEHETNNSSVMYKHACT